MRLLLVLLAVIVLAEGHVASLLPMCDMCKGLVSTLKGNVEGGVNGVTQELAKKFCEDNFPVFPDVCISMVQSNIKGIMAGIMNKVDTEKICMHMLLCW
ncbi:unnamed protein product [Cylicocyclus nassatus]|uniref:Saposin B-type domain-containing protein n=1 Tax=Cylicocyclus nassatus TaxID=53992 RepID=A0AA36GKL5_CYLNA|nr:unnamed protein product [Cylicocyclus nassatus]